MIKITDNSIFIEEPDGHAEKFDVNELQLKITESCITSGMGEPWIAEDIALAVEYALKNFSADNNSSINRNFLNSSVINSLKQLGLNETAEHFRNLNNFRYYDYSESKYISTETITELLKNEFQILEKTLKSTAYDVSDALKKLEVKELDKELIRALAKYFYSEKSKSELIEKKPEIPIRKDKYLNDSRWLISKTEILQNCPQSLNNLISKKIFSFSGISSIFPALKIFINAANFAEFAELQPPATNLEIIPNLKKLSVYLSEFVNIVFSLSKEKYPVYINITSVKKFCTDFYGGKWPESQNESQMMFDALRDFPEFNCRKLSFKQ